MVYVDNMRARFRQMIMCHMIADTPQELQNMAIRVGLRLRWYQVNGRYPHFDICEAKRRLAVKLGAKEVTMRQLVQIIHALETE